MLFLHSSLAIAATLAINAFALPVEPVQEDQTPAADRILFARGMPGCPIKYGEEFEEKNIPDSVLRDAARSLASRVTYDRLGWKHPICNYYLVNCYAIEQYIHYDGSSGDIGTELGHWYGNDGSELRPVSNKRIPRRPVKMLTRLSPEAELLAFKYWHNELGFSGRGGSVKIYPAHGYFFTCTKGWLQVTIYFPKIGEKGAGGSDTLRGNDAYSPDRDPDGWEGPCKCYGNTRWDIHGADMLISWRH
ncbi:hypothetical protein Tdes44962_MAKER07061 [Teratosphaeria destructans]|uniref:Uncharacterized protein n=1 Tax=Teratosphaeria destructans TaxID=418781 RepID=A0A9W7T072_9PEZI|nr:hypothetical protein Tdes44962_MAKER07061 [Teratosphaeria destructans]